MKRKTRSALIGAGLSLATIFGTPSYTVNAQPVAKESISQINTTEADSTIVRIENLRVTLGDKESPDYDDYNILQRPNKLIPAGSQVNIEGEVMVESPIKRLRVGIEPYGLLSHLNVYGHVFYGDGRAPLNRETFKDTIQMRDEEGKKLDHLVINTHANKNGRIKFYGKDFIPIGETDPFSCYNKIRYAVVAERLDNFFSAGKKSYDSEQLEFRVANGSYIKGIQMRDEGENYAFDIKIGANGMCHNAFGSEFSVNPLITYFEEDGKKQESLTQGKIPLEYIAKDENERTISYQVPKTNLPFSCNPYGCGTYLDFLTKIYTPEGESDELKQGFYIGE